VAILCLCFLFQELSDDPEDEHERHINQIKTLYAYDLFKNKKFKESMNLFLSANAGLL